MRVLILVYSFTGNNRHLALHLANRLGAAVEEVRERRRRTVLRVVLDMMFRRRPAVHAIDADPAAFDHVLLIAPIWDMNVAHPMASAIRSLSGRLGAYSFVTLCGYVREGQPARITRDLTALAGHPPETVDELFIGNLFPAEARENVKTISAYRVTGADLTAYEAEIAAICHRLTTAQAGEAGIGG